jgi:CrcB protein
MNGVATYAWVAAGGALGSMARFWMGAWLAGLVGARFPWGTLLINMIGAGVIGLVAGLTLEPARLGWHPDFRIFLMVGICGGFTTFSAFSLQMLELLQLGQAAAAAAYSVVSVMLCLGMVWGGFLMARVSS